MIIKGGRRGGATQLAAHLLRRDSNEDVVIREIDNLPSGQPNDKELRDALRLMEKQATAKGKERTLYHAIIALQKGETLSQAQIKNAVDTLAANLGMKGHQRVIVEHRKDGRQHFHVVFNMVNPVTGKTAWLSWSRKIQWDTARNLEKKFGLKPVNVKGRASRQWEHQRSKRSGIDPTKVRKEVTAIYRGSKTGKEFIANLEKAGYVLTKGRNNSYVIVDRAGDIHGLMRRIEGAKVKDLRRKFPDLKSAKLPVLEDVLKQRRPQRPIRRLRRMGRITPRKRILQPAKKTNIETGSIKRQAPAPRLPNPPNKYAALAVLSSRIPRPARSDKNDIVFHAPIHRRRKRKNQNTPDSEKTPIRRPEMDTAELIAWAFENGRLDVLASFGIHLSPETFEP